MKKNYYRLNIILLISLILLLSVLGYPYFLKVISNWTITSVPKPYEDYTSSNIEEVMGATTVPKGYVKIPVLMYHNIGGMPARGSSYYKGMFVTPYVFEQQMRYLVNNHYKTLTPQEFYNYLKSGKNPPQKSVLITFDDGSKGQYKYAFPILKKYHLTATFFIISDRSQINPTELRKMSKAGMIIDSHSTYHEDLRRLNNKKQIKLEVDTSKKHLEKITGKTVNSIAYPGCVADSDVFNQVNTSHYLLGFSCGRGIYHTYKNRFYLSRVHIFNSVNSFIRTLQVGLY